LAYFSGAWAVPTTFFGVKSPHDVTREVVYGGISTQKQKIKRCGRRGGTRGRPGAAIRAPEQPNCLTGGYFSYLREML